MNPQRILSAVLDSPSLHMIRLERSVPILYPQGAVGSSQLNSREDSALYQRCPAALALTLAAGVNSKHTARYVFQSDAEKASRTEDRECRLILTDQVCAQKDKMQC